MTGHAAGFLGARYAIAGVGETDWSRDSGRTPLTLAVQAARAALADAGLAPAEVDGFLSYAESDSADGLHVASALGARPTYTAEIVGGGSSAEFLVATAAAAIQAGLCSSVLCYRAMNGRSGRRFGHQEQGDWSLESIYPFALNQVVRQLRGDYAGSERQVPGAEVGLVTGWGGPEVAGALLLGRAG